MKSLRLQLFLPVVLVSVAPAVQAAVTAPATPPAQAPATVKPPLLQAESPLVAAQFERIAQAYNKLGSFSLTATDTTGSGKDIDRASYTAYFGADGRLGLKISPVDGATEKSFTQLFDGHELISSSNGHAARRIDAKTAQENLGQVTNFFEDTFGAEFIRVLSQYGKSAAGYQLFGSYSIQDLPGGRTRIENITNYGEGKEAGSATTVITVNSSGLIESLEASGIEHGQQVFHAASTLGQPAALDANTLTWEKFGPKPNPNFTSDEPSRRVFERAAKLYGIAASFSTKISGTIQHSDDLQKEPVWTADVSWERRGRLRLESSRSDMVYAYDGTNSYVFNKGKLRQVPTFTQAPEELTLKLLQTIVPDDDPFMTFPRLLVHLLTGSTTDFTDGPQGLDTRKVLLEPDTALDKVPCSVVHIVSTVRSKTDPVTLEDRYWFAEVDGSLLRVTSTLKLKDSQSVTDVRLNGQQLNTHPPDSTWKLTEPIKAVPVP